MISRWSTLALFAIAFTPGLLRAQQATIISSSTAERTYIVGEAQRAIKIDKMYEDIEIMRRILDRKLAPLYPSVNPFHSTYATAVPSNGSTAENLLLYTIPAINSNGSGTGSVWFDNTTRGMITTVSATPLPSLEGVYLKGQGVVYTATLASLQPTGKAEAKSTAKLLTWTIAHPESEWDNIRRQVRNEKEEPKKPEWSIPPSLSDVLLKVLAENGHHFSQLGENESLTIVLTLHQSCSSPPAAKSGTGATNAETKSAVTNALLKEAGDLGLLGSMHLKQAKYKEAITVYQKLLSLAKSPNQEADVRRMLAMGYLGMGENEKAHAELNKALALLKKEKEAKEKPAAKPTAELPVKLIVSAPKKLLDQVKEGKITFEEFRRQASVETLRFEDRR